MPRRFDYDDEDLDDCCCDGDEYDCLPSYSTPKKRKAPATPKSGSSKKKTSTPGSASRSKSGSPKKGKKGTVEEKEDDKPFPLFDLPAETIDQILADPLLHLRDHLSLAATCRTLRAAYYTPLPPHLKPTSSRYTSDVWRVLCSNRPFVGKGEGWYASPGKSAMARMNERDGDEKVLRHIWSREAKVRPEEVVVAHRSREWEEAIEAIEMQNITKTTAKTELSRVSFYEKRNPYSRSTNMKIYNEAAVESLALELHGGAFGHEELLRKRAASAAKRADTKAKRKAGLLDSPSPSKKSKSSSSSSSASKPLLPVVLSDEDDEGDGDEDEEDGEYRPYEWRETSPTPVAGPSSGSGRVRRG